MIKEMIKANGFRLPSTILGIIGTCFVIYNYMNPDTTVRTAAHVASHASHILNRKSTLLNCAYGTSSIRKPASQMFHNGLESNGEDRDRGTQMSDVGLDWGKEHEWKEYIDQGICFAYKETGILNKEGREI